MQQTMPDNIRDLMTRLGMAPGATYLNGDWAAATPTRQLQVCNPADGTRLAHVPDLDAAAVTETLERAHEAFCRWRLTTARERADLLLRWYDLIMQHQDDLAMLLTLEQGKPLNESRAEILSGAAFFRWFAEEARRTYGESIPSSSASTRLMTIYQPIGVVAAITPWNFPMSMIARKAAPAVAAGCSVVLKPAEDTPLSALALAALAERAGVPAGVFNVVTTGNPKAIGEVLCTHPLVRKVTFTGSTAVGKTISGLASQSIKKVSLELGGNAPFIVFADADLELAVEGAIATKYRNAGQTCICTNRIYVQDEIHEAFAQRYRQRVEQLKVGGGHDEGTEVGPMINGAAVGKTESIVRQALADGAVLEVGGQRLECGDNFYQPTLLSHVDDRMAVAREEIFGPVATLFRFGDEDEVIRRANDTEYGLAAYLYTRDLGRAFRVSEALEYGMVGINEGMISNESAPFGGVKASGLGREGSRHGIAEYMEIKYLCIGGIQ